MIKNSMNKIKFIKSKTDSHICLVKLLLTLTLLAYVCDIYVKLQQLVVFRAYRV